MAEQHNPPHEPQGTGHQEEEQQQLAREAPETHEPQPSQAAAEPQPQPAAAEPRQSQSAAEAQPQEAAAEPQPSPAAAEPGSEQPGAEQAAHAANTAEAHRPQPEQPEQPERPVQPEEPPAGAGADQQAPPEKRDFAEILAEFEQGKSGAERAGAPETGGATAGATPGTSAASGVPATPNVGQKVSGKVLSITGDQVFVDLGTKS
jgi:hypothetical protein